MAKIIAEISGNHGGDQFEARELIYEASRAGCDYAKFQLYRPEDMPDRHEGNNEEMYRKLMVHEDWLPGLFATAAAGGIGLFASVFSVRAVEALLQFNTPFIKLAAPESTRLPDQTYRAIVRAIPRHMLMASNYETPPGGCRPAVSLVCPPGHPPTEADIWKTMWDSDIWDGVSDHTPGIAAPRAYIDEGFSYIEKHFKLIGDCVDAEFSAGPHTMKLLCKLAHDR